MSIIEKLRNKKDSQSGSARREKTSLSDNGLYPAVCLQAAREERYFRKFRRNEIYNQILEHLSKEDGDKYLDIINKRGGFSSDEWRGFADNDLYGKPQRAVYSINCKSMKLSPTTVRYVKVLQDIVRIFNVKDISSVAEIGVGYGGEGRILTSYLEIKEYCLFDLPEVLALAEKYLGKYPAVKNKFVFVDGTDIKEDDRKYDLVISNYAFSELIRDVQDIYLNRVIKKAKRGYITWNAMSHDQLDGYSVEELLEMIPGAHIIAEEPLTAAGNCIIVW
ncbi:MAG: putative sugar O-methyltransferase [Lachnospiraceae bacterium]|nr:putative sugar O-methyltransferase [Lachnospiraceae bacterium]